ncbi:MAG: tetratricopeptide repeat protein [Legionella sp.]|uniref:tetratricopeptide repeat protein n=1 Tax=Legionella sp. TaxID=459 RepID=UPI0039E61471
MSNHQVVDQLNRHLAFLAQDENNLSLLVKISDLYVELNDLNSAQEYLNRANAIDRIACLGYQGLLHLNMGQFEQAKKHFTEALNYQDTSALRYNLGFAYFITSDLENAVRILSPIIDKEHHFEAMQLLARAYHGQGKLEQASTLINTVLTQDDTHSEALSILALLQFDNDENELALQTAERALAIDPDNYDAKLIKNMLGLVDQKTSAEDVEQLLQINPDDCRSWFTLGNVHLGQGNLSDAEECLKKALIIYPEFYDCSIALGWCLLLQDKMKEAFTMYQAAATTEPEMADSWGGLGLIHALKEELNKAQEYIQKSLTLNPECFLAEIAQVIYYNHTNPLHAKEHLLTVLKNTQVPVSEKLVSIIEEMHIPIQLH